MKKLNFLIVDDEKDILRLFEKSLNRSGHVIHSTSNWESALDFARKIDIDVAIIDVNLGGADGLVLARTIRSLPGKTPLTALMTGEDIKRFEKTENLLFQKPFQVKEVYRGIVAELDSLGKNNRLHPRFGGSFPVRITNKSDKFETKNVSKGGFFLKSSEPLPLNAVEVFEIKFNSRYVSVIGKIVWIESDPKSKDQGFGVQFVDSSPLYETEFAKAYRLE